MPPKHSERVGEGHRPDGEAAILPAPVWSVGGDGWSPTTAAAVLDYHAGLHDLLAHPNPAILSVFRLWADHADASNSAFGPTAFWPYRGPGVPDDPGWGAKFAGGLARGLFTATTYQVMADMCEVAEAVYEETAAQAGHIAEMDVAADCGFLWLDKPFRRTDPEGHVVQVRAVTWSPQSVPSRAGGQKVPGVRVSGWAHWDADPEAAAVFVRTEFGTDPGIGRTLRLLGPLILSYTAVVAFGPEHGSFGGSTDGHPALLHLVHALWLLLGMEITAVGRAGGVPRQARRRAMRSIRQGDVSVVTLRRSRRDGQVGESREIDWSCRWLVRGFWRHLESYAATRAHHEARGGPDGMCVTCGARVTWVRPYVKGPEGRPLKSGRTVHRLSR